MVIILQNGRCILLLIKTRTECSDSVHFLNRISLVLNVSLMNLVKDVMEIALTSSYVGVTFELISFLEPWLALLQQTGFWKQGFHVVHVLTYRFALTALITSYYKWDKRNFFRHV